MAEEARTMNVEQACAAQRKLQSEKGYPDFAPSSGSCWSCRRNIYQDYEVNDRFAQDGARLSKGYSVEYASARLITGCPHCNRSYCE